MTTLRALHGALACGAVSLAIGSAALAAEANYIIDAGSTQSKVDNACVGALPGATGEDCTYNQSNPAALPPAALWLGPVYGAGYYATGNSPFAKNPTVSPLPEAPTPDADKIPLSVTGTLTIDDVNGTECDGDDTIEARFEIAAGTRTFAGGPGTWAEESWQADTIAYVLTASVPDSQTPGAQGCEYIFGNKGFPTLIQTMGLSPAGAQTYPVDLVIGSDPIDPGAGDQDAWAGPEPSGIGIGSFEGAAPGFDGNTGVAVTLDQAEFFDTDNAWQCVDNFGDVNNPTSMVAGGACAFAPMAGGTPCDSGGSHFCGVRGIGDPDFSPVEQPDSGAGQENWIMRIVVDASGDIIVPAQIFANNESVVFAVQPAPAENNSWDGPLITFTATCQDCSIAKDDAYTFVTGTSPATQSLNIGANDNPNDDLNNMTTTLAIDAPGPQQGTCMLTGTQPGDVKLMGCDYTATNGFAAAFTDAFTYTLDATPPPDPAEDVTAAVTITVEENIAPVATTYTIDFDTQGVDPSTLRNTTNVLTLAGNTAGNEPAVTTDGTEQNGTVTVTGGDVTYVADADFFQGTDQFNYTITDTNFGSPNVPDQSDSAPVMVDIPNVLPTTSDVTTTVESGESVDFNAVITLGNGNMAQHTVDGDCDNGTLTVNSVADNAGVIEVGATYTSPAGFDGDATCTYTVTDEDGAGDAVDGVVVITVTESGIVIKLPGAGSGLGPWSIVMLLLIPLFRSRAARANAGVES